MGADHARHRLVVFLVSGLTSHIFGSLGVARRLRASGLEVEFWGESPAMRVVQRQGFVFHTLEGVRYCYDRVLFDSWRGLLRNPKTAFQVLRHLRKRRGTLWNDLLSFEQSLDRQLARAAPVAAMIDPLLALYYPILKARGVRCVLLQDKPLPCADPLVPPPTSGWVPRPRARINHLCIATQWGLEALKRRLRHLRSGGAELLRLYTPDRLVRAVLQRASPSIGSLACRRVGYDLHFADLEEWVLGAPEIDFARARPLPERVRYIGPCVDLQRVEPEAPIGRGSADPLIYVSMGTSMPSWNAHIDLLRRIIRAFGGLPGVQLVVSAGSAKARAELRNNFSNVHVSALLPQLKLLQVADLAIIHAGANALRECIFTDTPMLAFPREYDQRGNAARIVHHGLGLRGRRNDTVGEIRSKALRILHEPRFAQRIRECHAAAARAEAMLFASAVRTLVDGTEPRQAA